MPFLDQYIIPFKNLEQGVYRYDFKIDDDFFAQFPYGEVRKGSLDVVVELEMGRNSMILTFFIDGQVEVQCDRCLDYFFYPLKSENTLIVKFGDITSDLLDIDNQMIISREESRINVAKHIYDYIHLSLPIKKVHPLDENGVPLCDAEMLKKLEELAPKETTEVDSPWAAELKNILNSMN